MQVPSYQASVDCLGCCWTCPKHLYQSHLGISEHLSASWNESYWQYLLVSPLEAWVDGRAEVFQSFQSWEETTKHLLKTSWFLRFQRAFFLGEGCILWWRLFTVVSQLLRLHCPQKAGWKHFTWWLKIVLKCWTYVTKTWEGCFFQIFLDVFV